VPGHLTLTLNLTLTRLAATAAIEWSLVPRPGASDAGASRALQRAQAAGVTPTVPSSLTLPLTLTLTLTLSSLTLPLTLTLTLTLSSLTLPLTLTLTLP
jgi:hypothetical protein